ncbi:MAG TPA: endopeptidase La [Terriglobales bacterium]|nr:endopeptidase La [Terriglobales bacterium]
MAAQTVRLPDFPATLPVLPVRDTVLFPHAVLPLTVGRQSSVNLINGLGEDKLILVLTQKDARTDSPTPQDMHTVGTIAIVHKIVRLPNQSLFIFTEGLARARVLNWQQSEPFLRAEVEHLQDEAANTGSETEALLRNIVAVFQQIVALSPTLSDELQSLVASIEDPARLTDFVAANLPSLATADRQGLLENADVRLRLEQVNRHVVRELEVQQLRSKIQTEVQDQVQQSQREYYLREQMKAIQKELGEGDESQRDIEELRKKIEAAGMPDEVKTEALKELQRLAKMSPAAADYSVTRNYVEWLAVLPWARSSAEEIDVAKAKVILDEDHYDLEKVKERILDYLAVRRLNPTMKGPILCFVGPPGVGKTSLGRSIARSLGRKFFRLSLGGVHDEAEIRGHRRTYIGALPGQIIQGLRRADTNDPVFMLDEVDKIGRDFRGDPTSALLEVLDPEQNFAFRDNYLDVPFNLSKVLFITTANMLDTIPEPMRDRMEIIELSGYTEEEKLHIAFKYLIPKQAQENGVAAERLDFQREAVQRVIRQYTREAGVRGLERQIGSLIRKYARRIAEGSLAAGAEGEKLPITPEIVREFLGGPKVRDDVEVVERTRRPGVALGLAWTPTGGDVLFIEANSMPGGKGFTMTGHLGQVMQESMQTALTWVRSHAAQLHIPTDFFKENDIHMHVPAGAIPKDGPSAGITMATALASLLMNQPVRPKLAMTGEITLSGDVLPIGGVKEKVLAAKRVGVDTILLPAENRQNVEEDLKPEQLEGVTLHYVRNMEEVLGFALPASERPAETPAAAKPASGVTEPVVGDRAVAQSRRD